MGEMDGKVAVVTGAARGLGRVEALALAKEGCRVVVNDLGVASDGTGTDEGPAREVCDEIKSMGGEAVPHFGDVADWNDSKAMIQTAIERAHAAGAKIGEPESGVPAQEDLKLRGHALQCRITTEDPLNKFIPDYGRITAYRGATGFGIRLDGGTAYSGALITPFYDSLLEKVTAWGPTAEESVARMDRALREFRIRGVATNLWFLEAVIGHRDFQSGAVTTTFIDTTPELFDFHQRRDRATRLLGFIGEVIVNGNPEVAGRPLPA